LEFVGVNGGTSSELVEAVPLLIRVLEVPDLNVGRHVDFLAENACGFHQSFQTNDGVMF
jgi:hypothetical protein